MSHERRRIRLTFVASGESILAEMLDDEAPIVCEHIWKMLPVETKVIHGMYSGAEVFALLQNPQPLPEENLVQLPLPGELLYFYDSGKGAIGAKKPVAELVLVYGRGVTLRAHEGAATRCSLFARIPGDWKYDWNSFAAECRKARWEGPQVLRIEQAK